MIKTHKDSRDKYGRYLAELFVDGRERSLNQQLVDEGHAVEYMVDK